MATIKSLVSTYLSNKEFLTNNDLVALNDIISNELTNLGVSADEVSLMSPRAIMASSMNALFNLTDATIKNIKNESSILTAKKMSSIYSQLIQTQDKITLSTPSTMEVIAMIPISQIKEKGTKVQLNTYELEFTNENTFQIDGYDFRLVHDSYFIRVTTNAAGVDTVNAYYYNSNNEKEVVQSQKFQQNGTYYLAFNIEVMQVTYLIKEFSFSDQYIDKFVVQTDYPIYNFSLKYRDNSAAAWRDITARLYYTRGVGEFLQYQYLSNTSVLIDHKYTLGGFMPSINGTLHVDVWTTTGQPVYFTSSADITNRDPYWLDISYMPVDGVAFNATGGSTAMTSKEALRSQAVVLASTRRRIDTETDMEAWFDGFKEIYNSNSVFKPKLVVNDVKSRIFNVYTALTFNYTDANDTTLNFTIPSTSGDITAQLDDLPTKTIQSVDTTLNNKTWHCITPEMQIISKQTEITSTYIIDPNNTQTVDDSKETFVYITPFILSYNPEDNFCRTYMCAQYGRQYANTIDYDNEENDTLTRFIASSLTMNDYLEEESGDRVFNVSFVVRPDNASFEATDDTFKAVLILTDVNKNEVRIKASFEKDETVEDGRLNCKCDITTARHIFGTVVEITYLAEDGSTKTADVIINEDAKLDIYTKEPDDAEFTEIIRYKSPLRLFVDVTSVLYLQTNQEYDGTTTFVLTPMIAKYFWDERYNIKNIINEIYNIEDFVSNAVYTELDMMKSDRFTLRDLQETLFTCSIKFAKTYGRSKFLNIKSDKTDYLINLQVKPTINISLKDEDFDTVTIANMLNDEFTNFDFEAEDLSADALMSDILVAASDYINWIQFINFDDYKDNYHIILRNTLTQGNDDVPEILNIKTLWDNEAKRYKYDCDIKEL
jgi:hypothetical protein